MSKNHLLEGPDLGLFSIYIYRCVIVICFSRLYVFAFAGLDVLDVFGCEAGPD